MGQGRERHPHRGQRGFDARVESQGPLENPHRSTSETPRLLGPETKVIGFKRGADQNVPLVDDTHRNGARETHHHERRPDSRDKRPRVRELPYQSEAEGSYKQCHICRVEGHRRGPFKDGR